MSADAITLAACLTPPGVGAIAVVAVRGPQAWPTARACFRPLSISFRFQRFLWRKALLWNWKVL